MEALKETLLSSDFGLVRRHPKFKGADVQTKNGSIFTWTLAIPGGKGTSWEGLVYDVEIHFSRRHPFEPPRVEFPRTHRNTSNPGHPLVDGSGRLRMQRLSFDKWLPTVEASTVIGWLYQLFETEPPSLTSGNRCPFSHFSSETVLQVLSFLDAADLGCLSETGKHMLSLCFDEATWAKLYYRSSTSLDGLLGEKEGGACPVRVMGVSGKWYWEGAREAFIRSWEMRKACKGYAFATSRTQMFHGQWELGGLMTVAAGLLSDIERKRMFAQADAESQEQLRHTEYLLDSQTMKIASLQRLLTWSGVCRSLLGEKDEDRSAPRSMWDQTIGTFGCFRTGASTRGSFNSTTSGSGSGGDCAGAPGTGREELAGREPRLTDEQRTALRLLCGNLAAFPPIPQQSSTAEPGGERGETSAENGGTSGLPGVESCPHHHHSVSSPFIPFSMSRVELQPRTWWRDVHQVPDVANTGAAAAPSPMPAHISAPGYHGAGTGVAVADHPDASNSVAANGASMMRPHRAPAGDSGATLLNTQPACGRGGVYWPTLYDLTRVKNRQEERLRDCFRRFSPGQRVDVRDPSGVWMGAVVLYAPRSCGGGAWHDFNDGDVFHHAGHGGHGGAGGGGGGAHVEGGVNVPGVQASLHPHHDATTPEWRRLLQLALVADGGHIRLARLRAGRYRGPAAGGLPAAGSAPSCIDGKAVSFLASAVTAAADARLEYTRHSSAAAGPEWPSPPLGPGTGGGAQHPGAPADTVDQFQRMIAAMHMAGGAAAGAAAVGGMGMTDAAGTLGAAGLSAGAGGEAGGAPGGVGNNQHSWIGTGDSTHAHPATHGGGKSVLIHYEGHKSRYDEWITIQSPRLAPFRSRTTRPLSVTMQSVEKVVNGASVRTLESIPAPDCVEVSLSCPWISHCAGGGVVTYRLLPSCTTLGAVLADFCHLGGISLRRAIIFRARLHLALDMRRGYCDVEELDDHRTLKYFGVTSGAVLHVAVAPATTDIKPSSPACIPPPRPPFSPKPAHEECCFGSGARGGRGAGTGGGQGAGYQGNGGGVKLSDHGGNNDGDDDRNVMMDTLKQCIKNLTKNRHDTTLNLVDARYHHQLQQEGDEEESSEDTVDAGGNGHAALTVACQGRGRWTRGGALRHRRGEGEAGVGGAAGASE